MSVSDPQMCRRVLWVFVGSEPLVSLLCVRRVEPVIINSSYGNADACFQPVDASVFGFVAQTIVANFD